MSSLKYRKSGLYTFTLIRYNINWYISVIYRRNKTIIFTMLSLLRRGLGRSASWGKSNGNELIYRWNIIDNHRRDWPGCISSSSVLNKSNIDGLGSSFTMGGYNIKVYSRASLFPFFLSLGRPEGLLPVAFRFSPGMASSPLSVSLLSVDLENKWWVNDRMNNWDGTSRYMLWLTTYQKFIC